MSLSHSQSNASSRSNILSLSSNEQQDSANKKLEAYNRLISKLKNILNRKLHHDFKVQTNDTDELCDQIQTLILGRQSSTHSKQEMLSLIKDFQDIKGSNRRVRNIVEILEAKLKFRQRENHNFQTNTANQQENSSNHNQRGNRTSYPPLPYSPNKNTTERNQEHSEQAQILRKRNHFYQQKISDIANQLKAIKSQLSGICEKTLNENSLQIERKSSNKKSSSSQSEDEYILMPNGQWISQNAFIKQKQRVLSFNQQQNSKKKQQNSQYKQQNCINKKVKANTEENSKILKYIKFNRPDMIQQNVKFAESEWIQNQIPKQQRTLNQSVQNKSLNIQNKLNRSAVSDRSEKSSQISKGKQRILNSKFKVNKQESLRYDDSSHYNSQDQTPIDDLQIHLNLQDEEQIKITDQMKNQDIQKLAKRNKMLKEYAQKLQSRISFISKAKNLQEIIKSQEQHRQTGFTEKSTVKNLQNNFKKHEGSFIPFFQSKPNSTLQDRVQVQAQQKIVIQSQLQVRDKKDESDKRVLDKIMSNESSNLSILGQSNSMKDQVKINDQIQQKSLQSNEIEFQKTQNRINYEKSQNSRKIIQKTTKQMLFEMKNVQSQQDLPQNQLSRPIEKRFVNKNTHVAHSPSIHYQNHQQQRSGNPVNQKSQVSTSQNIKSNVTVCQPSNNQKNSQTIHMITTSKTINQSENQSTNRNNRNPHIQNHQISDKNLSFMSFRDNNPTLDNQSLQKIKNLSINETNQSKQFAITSPVQYFYKPEEIIRRDHIPSRPKTPPHCMVQFQQIKRKSKSPSQINGKTSFNEEKSPTIKSKSINHQNQHLSPVQKLQSFHSPQRPSQQAFKQSNTFSSISSIPPPILNPHRMPNTRINETQNSGIHNTKKQGNTLYSMVSPYQIPQGNRQLIYSQQPAKIVNVIQRIPNWSHNQQKRQSLYVSPTLNRQLINQNWQQKNFVNQNRQSFKRNSRSKSSKGILLTSPKHSQAKKPFWREYQRRTITQNVTTYY